MTHLLAALFGCSHRRYSRVWTPVSRTGHRGHPYVVCCDCGTRMAYDLTAMRITGPLKPSERRAEAVEGVETA